MVDGFSEDPAPAKPMSAVDWFLEELAPARLDWWPAVAPIPEVEGPPELIVWSAVDLFPEERAPVGPVSTVDQLPWELAPADAPR